MNDYLPRPQITLTEDVFVHFKHCLAFVLAINDFEQIIGARHDETRRE